MLLLLLLLLQKLLLVLRSAQSLLCSVEINCWEFTESNAARFVYRRPPRRPRLHHGRIQPVMLGGAKPPISGQGQGLGFLGRRCSQLGDLGERCKLPKRDPGRSPPADKWFTCILETPDSLSRNLSGPSSGAMAPLNPPMGYTSLRCYCGTASRPQ